MSIIIFILAVIVMSTLTISIVLLIIGILWLFKLMQSYPISRYSVKMTPYILEMVKQNYINHDNYCFLYIKSNRFSLWNPVYIDILDNIVYYEREVNGRINLFELKDVKYISDKYGYYYHKTNELRKYML